MWIISADGGTEARMTVLSAEQLQDFLARAFPEVRHYGLSLIHI